MWKEFFLREANDRDWVKQYLAQIAFEVYLLRLSWGGAVGEPREFKDFLLKFDYERAAEPAAAPVPPKPPPVDEKKAAEDRMKYSKAAWGSFLGNATKKGRKAARKRRK